MLSFVRCLSFVACGWLLLISTAVTADGILTDEEQEFHNGLLVLDSHVDIPVNFSTPVIDPARWQRQQVDVPKMTAGGMDAAFFIVYVDQSYRNAWEYAAVKEAALNKFRAIHRMTDQLPGKIEFATTASDIRRITSNGKHAILIGIENGFAIGQDLNLLRDYFQLGARYMTLVHNGHNDIGDSAQPQERFGDQEEEHKGLSTFGKDVVREMNRLGMIVDVSHASKNTMMDAVTHSAAPVIASHSAVSALVEHARNIDDEQLELLKKTGGVIQIAAVDDFLRSDAQGIFEAIEVVRKEFGLYTYDMDRIVNGDIYTEYHRRLESDVYSKIPRATVKHLVDHIDYVVEKIGVDHVGLASDFDGDAGIVGWDNAAETANVTKELMRRGYSDSDVAKIWGENLLRVMTKVEEIALQLQAQDAAPR